MVERNTRQPQGHGGPVCVLGVGHPLRCLRKPLRGRLPCQAAQDYAKQRHKHRAEREQEGLNAVHGQHQGQQHAQHGQQQAPAANTPAGRHAVCSHGTGVGVTVGVVDFVNQDQRQGNQAALCQQQRSDQIGAGQRQCHQHAQAIAPHIRYGKAQPGAAHGTAAIFAMARIVGHQGQPGNGHGNHQVHGGQPTHATLARTAPQALPALLQRQAYEVPCQPQQRQHHQRQGHAGNQLAHQFEHGAADQQRDHATPHQGHHHGPVAGGHATCLAANGHAGVAHHHQLKRAPANQLHQIEHDRELGKLAPIHMRHQCCAGQAGVTRNLGHPAQQASAQQRAARNGQQRLLWRQRGQQISAHLHNQQAHAQAEPQRSVVMHGKDALSG